MLKKYSIILPLSMLFIFINPSCATPKDVSSPNITKKMNKKAYIDKYYKELKTEVLSFNRVVAR